MINKLANKNYLSIKRLFDISLSLIFVSIFIGPAFLISILIKLTSNGPVLYWSDRIGQNNVFFRMPKFRTMHLNSPVVATHLLESPSEYLIPIGSFLRKTSLDEIPQLWSILVGDMSFVGPRPALFNQFDLINLRTEKKIHTLIPGLTGLAQINGRDALTIIDKVFFDEEYLKEKSFFFDLKILYLTIIKIIQRDGVRH